MLAVMIEAPFGPPVPEIPLASSPLVFVVCQVRFERIAAIGSSEAFIAPFQEAIRADYPIMSQERSAGILVGPDARIIPSEGGATWRFDQRPEQWQVSLAPDFVALSTRAYSSRADLLRRLRIVLDAVAEHLNPRFCERMGVRYVDRVTNGELLARLAKLVTLPVLGAAVVDPGEDGVERTHEFVDAIYSLPGDAELHGRWGLLPAGATFDPGIEPAAVNSWVLDLDVYTRDSDAFHPATIAARTTEFCERIYRFFRWAVTDEFLTAHGGQP